MKQAEVDKYSVAWFKLADLVGRGEKERALGVYRLLSHSIEDEALAYQLEADLLWSFDDNTGASERYKTAAMLYYKTNRLVQAAAVYEHLNTIDSSHLFYLEQLQAIYMKQGNDIKLGNCLKKLCLLFLTKYEYERAYECFQYVATAVQTKNEMIVLYADLFLLLMTMQNYIVRKNVIDHLSSILDAFVLLSDQQKLQQFLIHLETNDKQVYQQALAYLNREH